jgi:phage-related tail fiber protein
MSDILVKFRVRRGTAAQWASVNPVLFSGEPGFETDTRVLRIGDGVTAFTSLKRFASIEDIDNSVVLTKAALTGMVGMFLTNTAPAGWLKANGAAVSRTVYADLFARIGTIGGAGDGVTTFNVPDLRGEFLRGWDDGRGVDAGRVFGSAQADEFKLHNHSWLQKIDRSSGALGNAVWGDEPTYGTETLYTTAEGGIETRPRNIALLACIKF